MWEYTKAMCSVKASPPVVKPQQFPHPIKYKNVLLKAIILEEPGEKHVQEHHREP